MNRKQSNIQCGFQRMIGVVVLGGLLVVSSAGTGVLPAYAQGAASISFSQSNITKALGNDFSLGITINPFGESIDTARVVVAFPKDLVEVVSFNPGGFLPERSPGSTFSNTSGSLSWGMFSVEGPAKSAGSFGTITFRPIREGKGIISVQPTSHLISVGEEKVNYGALGQTAVTITGGRLEAPPPPTEPAPPPKSPTEPLEPDKPEQVVEITKPAGVTITSVTQPRENSWYVTNDARFEWTVLEGVSTYLVGISQNPEDLPKTRTRSTSFEARDLVDGVWYFSVAAAPKVAGQTPEGITRYRVQIDTKAPRSFTPILEALRINGSDEVLVRATFGAVDEVSGIDRYEISVNDGEFQRTESPYTLKVAGKDKVRLTVRAYDMAENYRENTTELLIDIGQLPVISEQEAARLTNAPDTRWRWIEQLWQTYRLSFTIMAVGLAAFTLWAIASVGIWMRTHASPPAPPPHRWRRKR